MCTSKGVSAHLLGLHAPTTVPGCSTLDLNLSQNKLLPSHDVLTSDVLPEGFSEMCAYNDLLSVPIELMAFFNQQVETLVRDSLLCGHQRLHHLHVCLQALRVGPRAGTDAKIHLVTSPKEIFAC